MIVALKQKDFDLLNDIFKAKYDGNLFSLRPDGSVKTEIFYRERLWFNWLPIHTGKYLFDADKLKILFDEDEIAWILKRRKENKKFKYKQHNP